MNTALIWAMTVTSFIVTIMGGVLLTILLFYCMYRLIASIWERTSAAVRNTREYMRNKSDFELCKRDIEIWDEENRRYVEKCSACGYRKEAMGGTDHEC